MHNILNNFLYSELIHHKLHMFFIVYLNFKGIFKIVGNVPNMARASGVFNVYNLTDLQISFK